MARDEFLSDEDLFGMTPKKAEEIRKMVQGFALGKPRRPFYTIRDSIKYGVGGVALTAVAYGLWQGIRYLISQYHPEIAGFVAGLPINSEMLSSLANSTAEYVNNDLPVQINSAGADIAGLLGAAFLSRFFLRKLSKGKRQMVYRTEPGLNLTQLVAIPTHAARQMVGMYSNLRNTVPFILLGDFVEVQEVSSRNPGFNEKPIFDFAAVEYRQLEGGEQRESEGSTLEGRVIDAVPVPSPAPLKSLPYGGGDKSERNS